MFYISGKSHIHPPAHEMLQNGNIKLSKKKKNEQKFPSLCLQKHTSPLKSYMFEDRQDGGREDGINCENSLSMQHFVLKELSAEQSPTEKSTFFSQKATNV